MTGSYVKPNIASLGTLIARGTVLPSKQLNIDLKHAKFKKFQVSLTVFFRYLLYHDVVFMVVCQSPATMLISRNMRFPVCPSLLNLSKVCVCTQICVIMCGPQCS